MNQHTYNQLKRFDGCLTADLSQEEFWQVQRAINYDHNVFHNAMSDPQLAVPDFRISLVKSSTGDERILLSRFSDEEIRDKNMKLSHDFSRYLISCGAGNLPIRAEYHGEQNEAEINEHYFKGAADPIQFDDPRNILDENFKGLDSSKPVSIATQRTYRVYWRQFIQWCEDSSEQNWSELRRRPCPVRDTHLCEYIAFLGREGASLATQRLALSAIKYAHTRVGYGSPVGVFTELCLRSFKPKSPKSRKTITPISLSVLQQIISEVPRSIANVRDNALLLLTFSAALNRKQIQNLKTDSLQFTPDGIIYTPEKVISIDSFANLPAYIPTNASVGIIVHRAVQAWLSIQSSHEYLFTRIDRHGNQHNTALTGQALQDIVRRAAKRASLPSKDYSVGSLRRGFAAECENANVERHLIRAHMRMRDDRIAKEINEPERGFHNSPLHALTWPDSVEP